MRLRQWSAGALCGDGGSRCCVVPPFARAEASICSTATERVPSRGQRVFARRARHRRAPLALLRCRLPVRQLD
jgi:hypothetical protein